MPSSTRSHPATRSRRLLRVGRRVAVAVLGASLCAIGTVLLFLPVPGSPVVLAGVAVLATEFPWAERALGRIRSRVAGRATRRAARRDPSGLLGPSATGAGGGR